MAFRLRINELSLPAGPLIIMTRPQRGKERKEGQCPSFLISLSPHQQFLGLYQILP